MDFFERFEEARHEFTYGDENAPDLPVVQVGLVATFFLDQSWKRRKEIIELLDIYLDRFGNQMKWLTYDEPVREREYTPENLVKLKEHCLEEDIFNGVEFALGSLDIAHIGDYYFSACSSADWYEKVHKDLSYVRYYLPIESLKNSSRLEFETLTKSACELLQPFHAQAGLAVQQCYEDYEYQHIEYEIAQQFLGLDVGHPIISSSRLRSGFKTVNWYTILSDVLLERLGGKNRLPARFGDGRITVLPYAGGAMIRAGEWPELGWVERDPKPELYVKVNRVLRPVRADKVSLAYGSVAGEVRFTPRTADLWLRRFDDEEGDAAADSPADLPAADSRPEVRSAHPGDPCPETGEWFAHQLADKTVFVEKGEPMPGPEFSSTGKVIWHLKRDN